MLIQYVFVLSRSNHGASGHCNKNLKEQEQIQFLEISAF